MEISVTFKDDLAEFWARNYVKNGLCDLCGNSGKLVAVRSTPRLPVEEKVIHFCICPNGMAHRERFTEEWLIENRPYDQDDEVPF